MLTLPLRSLARLLPKRLVGWSAYRYPSGRRAYGQFGEDVLLARLLPEARGCYVDIGAFHPKFGSNTYFLWKRGWRGINVDVDDYKIAMFRYFRPGDVNLTLGISSANAERTFYSQDKGSYGSMSSFEAEFAQSRGERMGRSVSSRTVAVRTLNWLFEEHLPREADGSFISVDLLNIDVEGHEYEILRAFDISRFRPRCVCVEIHAAGIDELEQSATFQLLRREGYQLVAWPAPSCIFTLAPLAQTGSSAASAANPETLRRSA